MRLLNSLSQSHSPWLLQSHNNTPTFSVLVLLLSELLPSKLERSEEGLMELCNERLKEFCNFYIVMSIFSDFNKFFSFFTFNNFNSFELKILFVYICSGTSTKLILENFEISINNITTQTTNNHSNYHNHHNNHSNYHNNHNNHTPQRKGISGHGLIGNFPIQAQCSYTCELDSS